MDLIYYFWGKAFDWFIWAWYWTIPGTNIQPVALGLFLFILDLIIYIVFVEPKENGGDSDD